MGRYLRRTVVWGIYFTDLELRGNFISSSNPSFFSNS